MVAVTLQVPLARIFVSTLPTTLQPVEVPTLQVTAPVPLPPVVLKVEVARYERVDGVAWATSVVWFAAVKVTVIGDEVAWL